MRRRRTTSPLVSDTEYFSDADSEDSPSPSGSTLPPPSTPQFMHELKAPDDADRAWYEFDLSVLLALLSPLVNWLTGSDHVKNILLIVFVVFYLHQIIEVPWSLYLASRPRHAFHAPLQDYTADKYHRAALSELHAFEFVYLTLSVLSPFLGATLLRTVVISFSGPSTVSWFSSSLFVLATGMRPWKHAVQRLRQRTTDLHTIIHYPPADVQRIDSLLDRIAQLEAELSSLRKHADSCNSDVYEHVDDAIEMLEISARRHEKKADVSKAFVEGRLLKLEQNLEALLERVEIRADTPALYTIMSHVSTFVSPLIDRLSPFLPTWVVVRWRGSVSRSPRSSPKVARSRTAIKLETIPEVATFQPKSPLQPSCHLRIPGFGLVLRICRLATLPLRWIITCLLAGRIYSSRPHPHLQTFS